MTENTKHIIEINGVKMEVDLRHATQIYNELKIGSKVKVLAKEYSSSHQVYHGVIVGFENFPSLPTIEVCYLEHSYGEPKLKFASINTKTSEKFEIVPALDWSPLAKKEETLKWFDNEIKSLEQKIIELKGKKEYCEKYFDVFVQELEQKSKGE
jgi:hypothetical protein